MNINDFIRNSYREYNSTTRKGIHLDYIEWAKTSSTYRNEPPIRYDDKEKAYYCEKGDYRYIFQPETGGQEAGGWWIQTIDKTKKTYGAIETNLYGIPVKDAYEAFKDCKNMVVAPEIPESVKNIIRTFENCISLQPPTKISYEAEGGETFKNCLSFIDLSNCDMNIEYFYSQGDMLKDCINLAHGPRSINDITVTDNRMEYARLLKLALGDTVCPLSKEFAKELEEIEKEESQDYQSEEYSEADDVLGDEANTAIKAIQNMEQQNQELSSKVDLYEKFINEMGLEKLWSSFAENNRGTKNTEDIEW